jgi:hypothetical protein
MKDLETAMLSEGSIASYRSKGPTLSDIAAKPIWWRLGI